MVRCAPWLSAYACASARAGCGTGAGTMSRWYGSTATANGKVTSLAVSDDRPCALVRGGPAGRRDQERHQGIGRHGASLPRLPGVSGGVAPGGDGPDGRISSDTLGSVAAAQITARADVAEKQVASARLWLACRRLDDQAHPQAARFIEQLFRSLERQEDRL